MLKLTLFGTFYAYLLTLGTLHAFKILLKHEKFFLIASKEPNQVSLVYSVQTEEICKISLLLLQLELWNVLGGNRKLWPVIPKITSNMPPSPHLS